MLAKAGFVLLIASLLVPGTSYDATRLPFAAAGAALLLAAGAARAVRRQPDAWPTLPWIVAAGAFLLAHVLSVAAAVNRGAALGALVPVASGLALFWALARGWVPRDFGDAAIGAVGAVAIAFGGYGVGQRLFGQAPVSTIGNTNYAGALAAILAAFSLGGALAPG